MNGRPLEKTERIISNDMRNLVSVEIGDMKDRLLRPQFKLKRWRNEANFSIRAEEKAGGIFIQEGDKAKYLSSAYEVHMYDKSDAGEYGGFEFEWLLTQKPVSNILRATIKTKGLNFFYQGELTEIEKQMKCYRPEHVIGSYAVYYDGIPGNGPDNHFRTGKFCHIYRPIAEDALGKKTYCSLYINPVSELLEVTVPQQFLNEAMYPVLVDPTFGYTSIGASQFNGDTDILATCRFTSAADATEIDSISQYLEGSGNHKGTIHTNANPLVLVTNAVGSVMTVGAEAWLVSTFGTKPVISPSTIYYLGSVMESGSGSIYYDSGSSNQMAYGTPTGGYSSPGNMTPAVELPWMLSVYATYEPVASGSTANWFM